MSILTNFEILLQDYDIGEIIDRERPIQQFKELLINPLIREEVANSVYVYGPPGTGKTYVIKKILEQNIELIKKHFPTFRFLWLNCKAEKTVYVTLTHMAKNLEEFLPIENIKSIPLKGLDYGVLFNDIIKKIVEKERLEFLIVLDEIDEIIYRDGDTFLYDLIYANQFLSKGHIYIVGISNDPNLENIFSLGVKDRLRYLKIHFPKYNAQELYQILDVFAKKALKPDSYKKSDLAKIASYVASVSGSARESKRILYFLAKNSESKLDISKLESAIEESEKLMFEKDIEQLPFHQQLIFFSIIKTYEFFEKSMQSSTGLKRFIYNYPTTGKVYEAYKEICKKFGETPRSQTTFKYMLKDLDRNGLIDIDIRSLGRRGLTSIIKPTKPIDIFKPIIKRVLGI